jgi:hypothetical protein
MVGKEKCFMVFQSTIPKNTSPSRTHYRPEAKTQYSNIPSGA